MVWVLIYIIGLVVTQVWFATEYPREGGMIRLSFIWPLIAIMVIGYFILCGPWLLTVHILEKRATKITEDGQ